MKLQCYIVKDLLYNYMDDLVSEESAKDIKEHLVDCKECRAYYENMKEPIPVEELSQEEKMENMRKVSFLKKLNLVAKIVAVVLVLEIAFVLLSVFKINVVDYGGVSFSHVDSIDYYDFYRQDGILSTTLFEKSELLPRTLPNSVSKAELDFYKSEAKKTTLYIWKTKLYEYIGYLVYSCNETDYAQEYKRLKKIGISEKTSIESLEEFPYELCAMYADKKNGVEYALADQQNHRFIYVIIEKTGGIKDNNIENKIMELPMEYLPDGLKE